MKSIRLSVAYDGWFKPYYIFRRIEDVKAQRYFGHKWYLLVHLLWWEFVIEKAAYTP